jgi:hypothetical protein
VIPCNPSSAAAIRFGFDHIKNLIRTVFLKTGITFRLKLRLKRYFLKILLAKFSTYDFKKFKKKSRRLSILYLKFQHQFYRRLVIFYRSHLTSDWADTLWCSYFCTPGSEKNIKKIKEIEKILISTSAKRRNRRHIERKPLLSLYLLLDSCWYRASADHYIHSCSLLADITVLRTWVDQQLRTSNSGHLFRIAICYWIAFHSHIFGLPIAPHTTSAQHRFLTLAIADYAFQVSFALLVRTL